MEENKKYITVEDLEVYKLARDLSKIAWQVYTGMHWQIKKILGDQFITATDSVGANIVEGYKRYHYLDKIKFYYNARASLAEADNHWLSLLDERNLCDKSLSDAFKKVARILSMKLNNFISATYKARNN